jgi:PncC family amidohydrolase
VEEPGEVLVGRLLNQHGLRLAVAESCTGGLVGHQLTNVPGSSTYFQGGVIAYANETKVDLLGVQPETLIRHGAVSEQTVLEMARGARARTKADIGLSVSGIAGPDGDTPEKPVGLVWIGLSSGDFEEAYSNVFSGDRIEIKQQAAGAALEMLAAFIQKLSLEKDRQPPEMGTGEAGRAARPSRRQPQG